MVCVSLYHQRRNEAVKDEELEYLADYDELTGMNNFAHYIREVTDIKNREGMRVVFANVDNFKVFNDHILSTFHFTHHTISSLIHTIF